jgi:hypothetical protein
MFLPKNPDPNATHLFVDGCKGLRDLCNGKMRSRYEILEDANASEELQREMRELVTGLLLYGAVTGLVSGLIIGILLGIYGVF